jgi:NitT/TauT family transport system substrate-binding protein
MSVLKFALGAASALAVIASSEASAADKISFGLNWLADPEHGGFFQAVADGTYAKYGLDVTIVPGGPQANNGLLLLVGKLDFYMGGNMIQAFSAVQESVPIVVVAAEYQKDPQVILSHPGVGLDKWSDLPKATAFISKEALVSFYAWMKSAYGFKDENVKPYTFNAGPFIEDKNSIQQGYLNAEPYEVEITGGFKPNIFLLADQGFSTYASTIEARRDTVEKNPDLVQRFVDASAIGWYHYLYGDNSKANEAIKKANPELTDGEIAYSNAVMKERGVIDSGDTATMGIGAITDARMQDFFDKMVKAGVFKSDLDFKKSYTLQFVDKGVGLDQRPK